MLGFKKKLARTLSTVPDESDELESRSPTPQNDRGSTYTLSPAGFAASSSNSVHSPRIQDGIQVITSPTNLIPRVIRTEDIQHSGGSEREDSKSERGSISRSNRARSPDQHSIRSMRSNLSGTSDGKSESRRYEGSDYSTPREDPRISRVSTTDSRRSSHRDASSASLASNYSSNSNSSSKFLGPAGITRRRSEISMASSVSRTFTAYSAGSIALPSPLLSNSIYPRPSNGDIEQAYQDIMASRGPKQGVQSTTMSIDSKWKIVEMEREGKPPKKGESRLSKTKEVKVHEAEKHTPEYYIKQMVAGTVTIAHLSALAISLRSYTFEWVIAFIDLKGQAVLANLLHKINRQQDVTKREATATAMETELLNCLKALYSSPPGAVDALESNTSINAITESLTSPSLPNRKVVLAILISLVDRGFKLVLDSLYALQAARHGDNCFTVWFSHFEAALDGRGKMGSVVGASPAVMSLRGEIARSQAQAAVNAFGSGAITGSIDRELADYAHSNVTLICALTSPVCAELTVAVHLRIDMDTAGLKSILAKIAPFDHADLKKEMQKLEENKVDNTLAMSESYQEELKVNLQSPQGVLDIILANTEGRALGYFISMMRHLLIVKTNDLQLRLRQFQLIDKLVTAVVMDQKGLNGDFTSMIGSTVQEIASRFGEQDQLENANDEIDELKLKVAVLKREKEELRLEIAQKDLAGQLKAEIQRLEGALQVSRKATETTKEQFLNVKKGLDEKIMEQSDQIQLLYSILEEKGLSQQMLDEYKREGGTGLSRGELLETLAQRYHRSNAIQQLERNMRVARPDAEQPKRNRITPIQQPQSRFDSPSPTASPILAKSSNLVPPEIVRSSFTWSRGQSSTPGQELTYQPLTTSPQSSPVRVSPLLPHLDPIPQLPFPVTNSTLEPLSSSKPLERSPTLTKQIRSQANNICTSSRVRRISRDQDGESNRSDSQQSSSTWKSNETGPTSTASSIFSNESEVIVPIEVSRPSQSTQSSPPPNDNQFSKPSSRGIASSTRPLPAPPLQFTSVTLESSYSTPIPYSPSAGSLDTPTPVVSRSAFRLPLPITPPSSVFTLPADNAASAESSPSMVQAPPPPPPIMRPTIIYPPIPIAPTPPQFVAGSQLDQSLMSGLASMIKSRASPQPDQIPTPTPPLNPMKALANQSKHRSPLGNGRPAGPSPTDLANGLSNLNSRPRLPPPPPEGVATLRSISNGNGTGSRFARKVSTPNSLTMKQFQWDKIATPSLGKTVFKQVKPGGAEKDWAEEFKKEGIFELMEQDFRAKKTKLTIAKKLNKNLESALDPNQRRKIEITLLKPGQANEDLAAKLAAVAMKVLRFDEDLTDTFVGELKACLPSAEQEGQLNVHKSKAPEELEHLHSADRFLVECLKIYRLRPRLDGMLYRMRFEDTIVSLEENANKILAGAESLLGAPCFKDLLDIILTCGNYMNGNGNKGKAGGFRVTSINKLIDTKSADSSDQTLLHFLAKIVKKTSPATEAFLTELAAPADASRSDLSQVRNVYHELQSHQKALANELEGYYVDPEKLLPEDGFTKMFPFSKSADSRLLALKDTLTLADGKYREALDHYGEDVKSITSTLEFFAIFKTFVVSYTKARQDNASTEERAAKSALAKQKKADIEAAAIKSKPLPVDEAMAVIRDKLTAPSTRRVRKAGRASSSRDGSISEVQIGQAEIDAATLLASLSDGIQIQSTSNTPSTTPRGRRSSRISLLTGNGLGAGTIQEVAEEEMDGAKSPVDSIEEEKEVIEE